MSDSSYGVGMVGAALVLLTACKFQCSIGGGNDIKGAKSSNEMIGESLVMGISATGCSRSSPRRAGR